MGEVPTPEAIVTATICSLCGLDWSRHPDKATAADCVGLLKADLATARVFMQPTFINLPPPPAPTAPYIPYQTPYVAPTTWCQTTTAGKTVNPNGGLTVVRDDPDDGCAPIGIPIPA